MALVYFTPLLRYPQSKRKIRLGFYGGNNNVWENILAKAKRQSVPGLNWKTNFPRLVKNLGLRKS